MRVTFWGAAQTVTGKKPRPWKLAEELRLMWWDLQALARHHLDKSRVFYGIRGEPEEIPLPPRKIEPPALLPEVVTLLKREAWRSAACARANREPAEHGS